MEWHGKELKMASAVQWIKITTDLFDDEKILMIDSLPEADKIIIIWFKLLCLAGKQNNKGVFMFNNTPYTTKMLSTILRREESVIIQALDIFESFGMIHYENNAVVISNWGKHQNLDKIEANNVYMREYMREYRKKQRDVAEGNTSADNDNKVNGKVNGKVKINNTDTDIELESETETEQIKQDKQVKCTKDKSIDSNLDIESIINSFNSICVSLPKVIKLSDKRKKAIKRALSILGDYTFQDLFEKVEASDFLTGKITDWSSSFDWILIPNNIVKILEGNYDNRKSKPKENFTDTTKYQNIKMEV